jgi:hypothetical protein
MYHDIHIKFHKDWFSHSEVNETGDSQTHGEYGDRISLLLFFQNKGRRLKARGTLKAFALQVNWQNNCKNPYTIEDSSWNAYWKIPDGKFIKK